MDSRLRYAGMTKKVMFFEKVFLDDRFAFMAERKVRASSDGVVGNSHHLDVMFRSDCNRTETSVLAGSYLRKGARAEPQRRVRPKVNLAAGVKRGNLYAKKGQIGCS